MSTYAIIEESGGQRKVQQDDQILIDLVNAGEGKAGDTITVDKVLIVGATGGSAKMLTDGTTTSNLSAPNSLSAR